MAVSNIVGSELQRPLSKMTADVVNIHAPIFVPEVGDLLEAFNRKTMRQKRFCHLMRMHGIWLGQQTSNIPVTMPQDVQDSLASSWENVLNAKGVFPTADQLLVFWRRGIIDDDTVATMMDRQGFGGGVDKAWYMALRDEIPGPSDLVTFVVRDIWRPDLVKKYGYDLDYPQQFADWLGKQGLNYEIPSPAHVQAGLGNLTWAKAYWWAHWQVPSVGQGIQMVQRLRGTLRDPAVPRDPSGIIFTKQDLLELIQVSDYPKYWQDKLMAIGYVPIGIRNLRNLWATGLATELELAEIFLDQGYVERDARLQARLIANEKPAQQLLAGKMVTIRETMQSYELGMIDRGQCLRTVHSLLLRTQAEVVAFGQLAQADQDAEAGKDRVALQLVGNADLTLNMERVKRLLAVIKSSYVRGILSEFDTKTQLVKLGIVPARAQQYMADWGLERILPRRLPSLSQAVKWLNDGIITPDQARVMLGQLGYVSTDIDAILVDATLTQIGRRVKAVKARASGVRKEQNLMAQQARALLVAQRQAQQALSRSANPARLARWFKDGLITQPQFITRVEQLGIAPADAALWASEIAAEVAAAKAKAAAKVAPFVAPQPSKKRKVPVATIGGWYKKKLIPEADFKLRLADLGYEPADIAEFVKQYAPTS